MAYSMDALTDDCYEGTACLINKLNIRDESVLADTEAAIVLAKASYLDLHSIPCGFDLDHLCEIHRFLFCDLYDWAGQLRTVNISKKGTSFTPANEIKSTADACFERIHKIDFSSLSKVELAGEVADFYNTLNMIHPFREGNGRAQRSFFTFWLRDLGYQFDFAEVDQDLFMIATIKAAQGVQDDLISLFLSHITPYQMPDIQLHGMDGGQGM